MPFRPATAEAIIGTLEAATDANHWTSALDRIATATGGHGALLMVSNTPRDDLNVAAISSRYGPQAAAHYSQQRIDASERHWLKILKDSPPETILKDTDVWPDASNYDAQPLTAWLRSAGVYHRCAVRVCEHQGWHDAMAILYPAQRDGIRPEEAAELRILLPYLAQVIEAQRPFVALERRYGGVLSYLDRLAIGVFMLTAEGDIGLMNAEGQRLVEADDGLGQSPWGQLTLSDPRAAAHFERGLQAVVGAAALEGPTASEAFPVPRRSEHPAYALCLMPLREKELGLGPRREFTGALVFAVDPARREAAHVDGLAATYQLSPKESEVCALLMQGLTNRKIAEHQGVSEQTIKTQVTSLFTKTNTQGRTELLRRAFWISPSVLDPTPHGTAGGDA